MHVQLPITLCRSIRLRLFFQATRCFSWKSRLNRDPELRQKKLESLNKRYTLRRIDVLDGEGESASSGGQVLQQTHEKIATILSRADTRINKITNIEAIDRDEVEKTLVGTTPLGSIASVSMTGSKAATVVVHDRGNIDRVLKALKHAFSHCTCTILGRERVEVKIPRITPEIREKRGVLVSKCVDESRKELKKAELILYKEIKTSHKGPSHATASLVERIKTEFSTANKLLDETFDAAIDKLGLE